MLADDLDDQGKDFHLTAFNRDKEFLPIEKPEEKTGHAIHHSSTLRNPSKDKRGKSAQKRGFSY